jgi:hypothetical protein
VALGALVDRLDPARKMMRRRMWRRRRNLKMYSFPSTRMGQVPKTMGTPSMLLRNCTEATGSTEPSCHMFMLVSCA